MGRRLFKHLQSTSLRVCDVAFERYRTLLVVVDLISTLIKILFTVLLFLSVGFGIGYAAIDEETTSIIIQGVATGEAVLLAIIFTIVFHLSILWFNKVHEIENSEKMAKKRRNLRPIGTRVEVKAVRQGHPSDAATVGMQPAIISEQQIIDEPDTVFMMEQDETDHNDDTVYLLDYIGGEMIKPLSSDHLRPLTLTMAILLLLSALFTLMGLMACKSLLYQFCHWLY